MRVMSLYTLIPHSTDLDNEFTLHKEAEEDTPEKRTFPLLVDVGNYVFYF